MICPDWKIGAWPPFGSKYEPKAVVDESLAAGEWIVFEGNTHAEAIRMTFADFCYLEHPLLLPIAANAACHAQQEPAAEHTISMGRRGENARLPKAARSEPEILLNKVPP